VVLIVAAILLLFPPNHALSGVPGYWLVVVGALLASVIVGPRLPVAGALLPGGGR
jgi:hypothetical protein